MRDLSPIVEITATLPVLHMRQDLACGSGVALELVRHDHPRHILQALQQLAEEPLGGFPIALLLDQDIEDDTTLIHGAPQVMLRVLVQFALWPILVPIRRV